MKKSVFLVSLLMLALFSVAQQTTITGKVIHKNTNAPLPGVTVQTKNKTVVTEKNGNFSIAASVGDTINFSFVGMKAQSVRVEKSTQNLDIVMEESDKGMNEVVVTGYISQRKKDLTGAVAIVDISAVKNNTSGNIMQSLQGRVAGLYIEKDGSPNGSNSRILIRGANTLGNNTHFTS